MNEVLNLKVRFDEKKREGAVADRNLRGQDNIRTDDLDRLITQLEKIKNYYHGQNYIEHMLVDVKYKRIIAKSSRIHCLFKKSLSESNDAVVGARFSEGTEASHIITYYVTEKEINAAIGKIKDAKTFISQKLNSIATKENFNIDRKKGINLNIDYSPFKERKIRDIIVDCSVISSFSVPDVKAEKKTDQLIITFFHTELQISSLLYDLDVIGKGFIYYSYGKDTISVPWNMYELLLDRVPYLISMISRDINSIVSEESDYSERVDFAIEDPKDEPIIGVIDTFFDETVYFNKWVENHDMPLYGTPVPTAHGTQVDSIIVDGPRLNPWLQDNCGRFRVRHFGVCESRISVPALVRKIEEIVNTNQDIHVWNLSLGNDEEVSRNFISYDSSVLDDIQARQNVVFVVAGTNDNNNNKEEGIYRKIGSPADSLNSLVVNAVKRNGENSSYTRVGPILSFFHKPDVSYYGGDERYEDRIRVYSGGKVYAEYGTSFAAPWISRKMCYLIDIMHLPREVAKALIIDSSAGWEYREKGYKTIDRMGYGIVPIDIKNILTSQEDEIRFILQGASRKYMTMFNMLPIPKAKDKYPYAARATLCYFPECARNQGVDYPTRELSIKFGRVNDKGAINDINANIQDETGRYINEKEARKEFRKWENTKLISKKLSSSRSLNTYEGRSWGISIESKERLKSSMKKELNFGVVVTLKALDGMNRIDRFISACTAIGILVNRVNIQVQNQIIENLNEEISIDD